MKHEIITQHIQDCFLACAVTSTKFLRGVRDSLSMKFFTSKVTASLVRLCYDYMDEFGEAPRDHFTDLVIRNLFEYMDDDEKEEYGEYIKRISMMRGENLLNLKYMARVVSDFIRGRTFEDAAIKTAELVSGGKLDEVDGLWREALASGVALTDDVVYHLIDMTDLLERDNDRHRKIFMPTGISELNRLIRGYRRGYFITFMGPFKGCKTWAMIHLAKHALIRGAKVLHITHEMWEDELRKRYDMCLDGFVDVPEQCGRVEVRNVSYSEEEKKLIVSSREAVRPSISNVDAVEASRKKIAGFGGALAIRKFPTGTCSIGDLEACLTQLEMSGFVPDVLINDYADIMRMDKSSRGDPRAHSDAVYKGLRRIADERGMLVVTGTQVQRQAQERAIITANSVAEDIR
ncbi:MAG: hypothetical protein HQ592_02540, partial [Planctomycetes bacterium]|nr:hypothetical protein [Planctomycetota bacterium]